MRKFLTFSFISLSLASEIEYNIIVNGFDSFFWCAAASVSVWTDAFFGVYSIQTRQTSLTESY